MRGVDAKLGWLESWLYRRVERDTRWLPVTAALIFGSGACFLAMVALRQPDVLTQAIVAALLVALGVALFFESR